MMYKNIRRLFCICVIVCFFASFLPQEYTRAAETINYKQKELIGVISGQGWDGSDRTIVHRVSYPVFSGSGKSIKTINKTIQESMMKSFEDTIMNP